jgi:hypothetical protein
MQEIVDRDKINGQFVLIGLHQFQLRQGFYRVSTINICGRITLMQIIFKPLFNAISDQ